MSRSRTSAGSPAARTARATSSACSRATRRQRQGRDDGYELERIGCSTQTKAQAKPAPPDVGTASGASVTAVAIALAIAAGIAGAVQAAVMGELGERTGVFPALAFSGVVTVILGLSLLLIVTQSFRGLADVARQPVWLWVGGALSVLIILAITVASPRIGLVATIGTIIALNLGMAAAIDRFGWFGLDRIDFGWTRAVGLVFLGIGAALTLIKS